MNAAASGPPPTAVVARRPRLASPARLIRPGRPAAPLVSRWVVSATGGRARAEAAATGGEQVAVRPAPPPAPTPTPPPTPAPAAGSARSRESESFQWFKHWYPVHVVEYLDPSRPHPVKLFGCNLVLWRDGAGAWRCMDDACPHRLAPLSEGRVEADGQLMCAYHGWKFGSGGECTAIPQAEKPVSEWGDKQKAECAVESYPTMEKAGLIWVWPETGSAAKAEAEATPTRGFDALFDEEAIAEGRIVRTAWSLRDLPYGWDYFVENVTDPAHVPVSHHNVVGNRYEDPKFFRMMPVRELSAGGMEYTTDRPLVPNADAVTDSSTDFQPPCLVRIRSDHKSEAQTNLCLFVVPTSPGRCRHIGCQVLVKNKEGKPPKGLAFFSLPMPKFLLHMLAPLFLHQDQVFLHHQERIVNHRSRVAGVRGENLYTMPTPADTMVIMFRRWFKSYAGGAIPWVPGTDTERLETEADPQALYDTYHAHTRHCTICQGALRGVELWQKITAFAGVAAAACAVTAYAAACASQAAVSAAAAASLRKGSAAALAAVPSLYAPSPGCLLLAGAALLCLAANLVLGKLKPLFFKYEFSHADNN